MSKLADSAGPSLLLYIKPRATFIWGFSPNVCTLPLQSCCSFYYQGDIIISLMLLDRKILCITPLFFHSTALHVFYSLSLFIYFFLYIFSLCRSLSTYIRVNETLHAKSRLFPVYILLPIFHSEKDGSSCGISPFPIFF